MAEVSNEDFGRSGPLSRPRADKADHAGAEDGDMIAFAHLGLAHSVDPHRQRLDYGAAVGRHRIGQVHSGPPRESHLLGKGARVRGVHAYDPAIGAEIGLAGRAFGALSAPEDRVEGNPVSHGPTGDTVGVKHPARGLVPHHLSREPAPGVARIAVGIGTANPAYYHLDQQLSLTRHRIRDFFYRPAVRPVVDERLHGAAVRSGLWSTGQGPLVGFIWLSFSFGGGAADTYRRAIVAGRFPRRTQEVDHRGTKFARDYYLFSP